MAGTDDKRTGGGEFWRSLVSGGIYKRQQGRIARQTTFAVFAITFSIGVWRLSQLKNCVFTDAELATIQKERVLRFAFVLLA